MQQAENPQGEAPSLEPIAGKESEQQTAVTIGSVLAAARAAQGLEIADVARSLKLSAKQVEALETDDFASLRGNTFVRGFIRNYAKLLQVDPVPLLDIFQQRAPAEDHALSATSQQIALPIASGRRRLVYIGIAAVAVIAAPILIYESLRVEREQPPAHSAAPMVATRHEVAQPAVVPPAVVPPAVSAAVEAQADVVLPEAPPPVVAPTAPEAVKPAVPVSPATPVAPVAPAVPAPQLKLVFEQTSWVEITDGRGKAVLSELTPGGTERVVEGRPPFSLVVGNATHVRIDYNGKPVDLAPHIRGDVARLTLQ